MKLLKQIDQRLAAVDRRHLRRTLTTIDSPCGPRLTIGDQTLLAFCSNDYLGLANHPELAEAMAEGAKKYGTGSGAAHLISGHSRAHAILETELAEWQSSYINEARALFLSTGYMANLAVVPTMAAAGGPGGRAIFADHLNHASLIDGVRLSQGCSVTAYTHADLSALDQALAACAEQHRLIVTDSVFSMDGNIAPLPELAALAEKHDAWLIVDDAHGFGVLGEHGRGVLEHFNLHSPNLIYIGTLGKAAGVSGAFVVAHSKVIEWLLQRARTYLFTTASPPAIAHTVSQSLKIIDSKEGALRRAQLGQMIHSLRTKLQLTHWQLADSATPIQPLLIGHNSIAVEAAQSLRRQGIWVPAIRPPTVPAGTARLRIALSAAHTEDDIDTLVTALAVTENRLITSP